MSRARQVLLHLLVSVVLGGAATYVVADHVSHQDDDVVGAPGDRVRTAVAGVEKDHVYVADDGRPMLSEAGERHLEQLISRRHLPVYVVVWHDSWGAGYDHYIQAADQILAGLPDKSMVVLWQGPDASTLEEGEHYALKDRPGTYSPIEEPSYLGDAEKRLTEWIGTLPDEPLRREAPFDYYGGVGGGIGFALLLGLPSLVGLWIVIGIVRVLTRRRFRNRPFAR